MKYFKIFTFLIVLLFLGNTFALEMINPAIKEITVYNQAAFIAREVNLDGIGENSYRIYLPRQADNSTLLVIDSGATIKQITVSEQDYEKLTKGVIVKLLKENLNENITVYLENDSKVGKLTQILRDSYIVVEGKSKSVIPISKIVSLDVTLVPKILNTKELSKELQQKFVTIEETAFSKSHKLTVKYFVSDVSWNPSYHLFLETSKSAKLNYWAEIRNNTAEPWESVNLKIVSGQPNLRTRRYIQDYDAYRGLAKEAGAYAPMAESSVMEDQFVSSSVSQQHAYDLKRKFSIDKHSQSLIPILSSTVTYDNEYVWNVRNSNVRYNIRLVNKTNEPLAEGWVSVYKQGDYVGGANLPWIATDKNSLIYLSDAKDIVTERSEDRRVDKSSAKDVTYYTGSFNIKNNKSETVEKLVLKDYFNSSAENFKSNAKYKVKDNQLEWEISLKPGEEKTITYTYNVTYYKENPISYPTQPRR